MKKHKYSHYEYKIEEIDVEIATYPAALEPKYKTGYCYEVLNVYLSGDGHESDEWYDTEQEAHIAAQDKIDELEEGSEPDYDVVPYGQIDWEERRRLGE